MNPILEKSLNPKRATVFGLLVSCIFTDGVGDCLDCPLKLLRDNLSIEKKHDYVMKLSDKKIEDIVKQHEKCLAKKMPYPED